MRDGNYKNRGELFLEHQFSGVELKLDYARDTLANLHKLWRRPVHIETDARRQQDHRCRSTGRTICSNTE